MARDASTRDFLFLGLYSKGHEDASVPAEGGQLRFQLAALMTEQEEV